MQISINSEVRRNMYTSKKSLFICIGSFKNVMHLLNLQHIRVCICLRSILIQGIEFMSGYTFSYTEHGFFLQKTKQ